MGCLLMQDYVETWLSLYTGYFDQKDLWKYPWFESDPMYVGWALNEMLPARYVYC